MTEPNLEKIDQIRLVSVLAITQKAMERFGKEKLAQIPDPNNQDLVSVQELGILAKDTLTNQNITGSVEQLSSMQQESDFQELIQAAKNYTNSANYNLVEKQLQELDQLETNGLESFKVAIQPLRIIEQSVDELEREQLKQQFEEGELDLDSPITKIRGLYFPSPMIYTEAEQEQQLKLDTIEALSESLAQRKNIELPQSVGEQTNLLLNSIQEEKAFSNLIEITKVKLEENQFFIEYEELIIHLDKMKLDGLDSFKSNFQSFSEEQRTSIEIQQGFKGISVEEQLARLKQNEKAVTINNSTTVAQIKTTNLEQETQKELQEIKEQLGMGEAKVQER